MLFRTLPAIPCPFLGTRGTDPSLEIGRDDRGFIPSSGHFHIMLNLELGLGAWLRRLGVDVQELCFAAVLRSSRFIAEDQLEGGFEENYPEDVHSQWKFGRLD